MYQKWEQFFILRNIKSFKPAVKDVVVFFTDLSERGLCYASIFSARSTLNNIIIFPSIYQNNLSWNGLSKPLKGTQYIHPGYKKGYNLHDYMDQLPVNKELLMKLLSGKTVMLSLLQVAERIKSLPTFSVESMQQRKLLLFHVNFKNI